MELYNKTDIEILKSLGLKIKEIRLEQNITQQRLANLAGVSLRRVGDVESGENHSVLLLVQILRALNHLELLSNFFTERQISPIKYAREQAAMGFKKRARAAIDRLFLDDEDEQW
ncbi:MAG: helix-turn-helix domain-containing protein [Rikenellaceae bacterium]